MVQAIKQLSTDQESAVAAIRAFVRSGSQQLTMGGLAGTGKTSIMSYLWPELMAAGAYVITPTGKAASVLRKKGIDRVSTIHALLYLFRGVVDDVRTGEKPVFEGREDGDWGCDITPKMLVCDEASMVNEQCYDDVMARDVPVIWVGDHGQLAPVGGDPGIMRDPDIRLEKIHRQAEGNPILDLALAVRHGLSTERFRDFADGDRLKIGGILDDKRLVKYARDNDIDQVIVGVNGKTVNDYGSRHKINRLFRESYGFKEDLCVGDRLICTFNNRRRGISNGEIFRVDSIEFSTATYHNCYLSSETADGWEPLGKSINVQRISLGNPNYRSADRVPDCGEFDFGHGITAHKSQGASWRRCLAIHKNVGAFDMSRWAYTAFTRPSEHLSVVIR